MNCVGWWNGRWWTVLAGGMVSGKVYELCWLVEWSMMNCWLVEWPMMNCVGWWNGRWWTVLAGGMVDNELCWLVEWSMMNCVSWWNGRWWTVLAGGMVDDMRLAPAFSSLCAIQTWRPLSDLFYICDVLIVWGWSVSLTCWIWLSKSGLQPSLTHMLDLIVEVWSTAQSHSHAGSDCLSLVYSPVSLTCWIWL